MPRFRLTYSEKRRYFIQMPETRSENIEADDLEEAQEKGNIRLNSNYPFGWTVSVEELAD